MPDLAPGTPIPGRAAHPRYRAGITPLLRASGSTMLFSGSGGARFIGPDSACWNPLLRVLQARVASFRACAGDPAARETGHHRTAARADSRLLPLAPDATRPLTALPGCA